ncbi:MAG: di-heme oxidoredictase family protein [Pseudomonadota bacterium]
MLSVAAAGGPGASELSDFHLSYTPRTDAERARIAAVVAPTTDFTQAERFETNPGGRSTVRPRDMSKAFSLPFPAADDPDGLDVVLGEAMFEKLWVSSPSSTLASDGLGPLYNARACSLCHVNDGRGHPPAHADDRTTSFVLRISVPGGPSPDGIADWMASSPHPTYGLQLQDAGTPGMLAEHRLSVTYEEVEVPLSGGEIAMLRKPTYGSNDLGYGPMDPQAMTSPRVAPQMIGLGLLEAIPTADILALADPDDLDGDGISGRPQIVPSLEFGRPMLGRFGHKAIMPTLHEQNADAFANDIGISSPLKPDPWGDCTAAQTSCRAAYHGDDTERGGFEVSAEALDLVTLYTQNLAVPARRDVDDQEVLRGKQVFHETGCISCHTPKHVTARIPDRPDHSFQLIWPYTDLLLHDMGEGLADHRPEGRATGREWRTPPLWGIGLTENISGHTQFLHDGRARSLLEAILWHGGEAQAQRDTVVTMPPADRSALIRFLESL